jgi:hypothetical protein
MKSNARDKEPIEAHDQKKAQLDARWREFWHDHKDFESRWSRDVLSNLSEFLPFVFKFDAISHGLKQFYEGSEIPSNLLENWTALENWTSHEKAQCAPDITQGWASVSEWMPSTELRRLPIFRLDLALRAYAYYGLKLTGEEPHDSYYGLDQLLEDWESDWSLFPRDWCGEEEKQTIMAALARRKLDDRKHGENITPDELAALARVSRKSIMNLLAPSNRSLLSVDKNGQLEINIESARSWLRTRADFRPSVWQNQDDMMDQPIQSEPLAISDPIFVPVTSDATWFSPEHRTRRRDRPGQRGTRSDYLFYYVANGDHEESHKDYWKALDFLNRAELPRWRYSDGGQWRTKNANGWIRKSRYEIEALLNAEDKDA